MSWTDEVTNSEARNTEKKLLRTPRLGNSYLGNVLKTFRNIKHHFIDQRKLRERVVQAEECPG